MFLNKEVKYEVTDGFGDVGEGVIVNAILLLRYGNDGLIYHPHVRGECPSIEVVEFDADEDVWVPGENNYLNIETQPIVFEKLLMGQDFSFKRKQFISSKGGVE